MNKLKQYAIAITVKPKPDGSMKYSSRTFRGIVGAKNPTEAKEAAICVIIKSFEKCTTPLVNREAIFIKECKCHNDFCISTKE